MRWLGNPRYRRELAQTVFWVCVFVAVLALLGLVVTL
jgi:F0F1-type ATP synthase membrane subunit c/vacuolar-type H+-ATPase subunit K